MSSQQKIEEVIKKDELYNLVVKTHSSMTR